MLRSVDSQFATDGMEQLISSIFTGEIVQEDLAIQDGTHKIYRNVGNCTNLRCVTSQKNADLPI